jgi:hypothetical protein
MGPPDYSVNILATSFHRFNEVKSPLKRSSANARYFVDHNGQAILLAGDHTWYTLQDSGVNSPPPAFNYDRFLTFLQANRINFFRMFVWEQSKWSEGRAGDYFYSPLPYERTGPDSALDGKPKFDLTRWNQCYFDRVRQRVSEAARLGIYVSVQLFQGFSVQRKPFMETNNPWPGHPYHQANNVNGIDGDQNRNGEGEETETLQIPAITNLQEAYVAKIVDSVNDLNNVLYEICNEAHSSSFEWQEHFVRFIHKYELSKPKQHPVGMTVSWPGGQTADLLRSSADWISPNSEGGSYDSPPAVSSDKVMLNDTDHLCYPCGDRQWMWKSITRGYNVAFMDPYDCTAEWSPSGRLGCHPNNPIWVSLRLNLGYAQHYAQRMNLIKMLPRPELASSGYCLANPTSHTAEYLVYLPSGRTIAGLLNRFGVRSSTDVHLRWDRNVTVDLTATEGDLTVEWFNPRDGTTHLEGTTRGGGHSSFSSPFDSDSVLYLFQAQH